jgi:hypothetical protein
MSESHVLRACKEYLEWGRARDFKDGADAYEEALKKEGVHTYACIKSGEIQIIPLPSGSNYKCGLGWLVFIPEET